MLIVTTRYSLSQPNGCQLSLRLGHRAALTAHRAVIHYRTAAPLRFATSRREPKKSPGGSLDGVHKKVTYNTKVSENSEFYGV